jgi:hypothetical protein
VAHLQVAQDQAVLAPSVANQALHMKWFRTSTLNAPSKIFQRIVPRLVTVEMIDKPIRLMLTRTMNARPCGVRLRAHAAMMMYCSSSRFFAAAGDYS